MQINRTLKTQPIQQATKAAAPVAAQATQPSESFTFSENKTPPLVKVGKYALAAVATAGAGALAYFAANNVGTAATVAGVANTWGYGAMTNSYNDIHNSRAIFLIGGNPAEAHPRHFMRYAVNPKGMHVPNGRDDRTVVVVDVRATQTSALADIFLQTKPGSDFDGRGEHGLPRTQPIGRLHRRWPNEGVDWHEH